ADAALPHAQHHAARARARAGPAAPRPDALLHQPDADPQPVHCGGDRAGCLQGLPAGKGTSLHLTTTWLLLLIPDAKSVL
ncbi:hypothetical protein KEM52_002244, partial [Ascosphaera acerosa]